MWIANEQVCGIGVQIMVLLKGSQCILTNTHVIWSCVCYHVFAKYIYEGSIAAGGYIVDDENFSTVLGLCFDMCMISTRDI